MDTQYRLRAYTPPRLSPAGSIRAVTALSGTPTPTIPPVTSVTQTTSVTSTAGPAVIGAADAMRRPALPRMPMTGGGGQANLAPAALPLAAPITVLALAVGLAVTVDDWGRVRRSRRDCWRWYAPLPAEQASQPG